MSSNHKQKSNTAVTLVIFSYLYSCIISYLWYVIESPLIKSRYLSALPDYGHVPALTEEVDDDDVPEVVLPSGKKTEENALLFSAVVVKC